MHNTRETPADTDNHPSTLFIRRTVKIFPHANDDGGHETRKKKQKKRTIAQSSKLNQSAMPAFVIASANNSLRKQARKKGGLVRIKARRNDPRTNRQRSVRKKKRRSERPLPKFPTTTRSNLDDEI
jgi:hypothetical protein